MSKVNARDIANDVDAAIHFFTDMLGFKSRHASGAGLRESIAWNVTVLLNRPGAGGAGQAMPEGRRPAPGGRNTESGSKVKTWKRPSRN